MINFIPIIVQNAKAGGSSRPERQTPILSERAQTVAFVVGMVVWGLGLAIWAATK